MNLLFNKSFEDLDKLTESYFTANNISRTPGGIARLLMNIINSNISELYSSLSINHTQAFLSTATGAAIDEIGYMLNCKRITGESDSDYRYRITQQVLVSATANETAIRLAALSVEGVQDIVLKAFAYGPGTYTMLILTDKPIASATIVENVRYIVNEVTGYGINFEIVNPDIKYVSLKLKLMLKDVIANESNLDVAYKVRDEIKKYLLSIPIGEPIIMNELTQTIMDVSDDIVSYICQEFRIDGKTVMFINQDCRWNERFMLSLASDAIIVE